MVDIVFPTSSNPGQRPQESSGRLINAFVEKTESGAPGQTLWRRSPGMDFVVAGGSSHTRGISEWGDAGGGSPTATAMCYWAQSDILNFVQVEPTGTTYSVATDSLPGVGPVTFARIFREDGAHLGVVVATAGGGTGVFTISAGAIGGLAPYPDADLPPQVTSVCAADNYFIFSHFNGKFTASQLGSYDINALSFNIEQGNLGLRAVHYANRLYCMGSKWIGVYRNAGTIPFPFLREATIPRGLLGSFAVAGWEKGWANELIFAGDDFVVYKLNGLNPVPISNEAVSRDIQTAVLKGANTSLGTSVSNRNLFQAFVYMYGKHAFWVLKFDKEEPDGWTWEYNVTTGQWNERQSFGSTSWRALRSTKAPNEWLVGDKGAGMFRIRDTEDAEVYIEDRETPVWTVESGVMSNFPLRIVIPRATFNITAGVGKVEAGHPEMLNPEVEISWSLDGGYTWGVPLKRKLGMNGDGRPYPYVISSGLSRGQGVRYRLQVRSAVHVGLAGGVIDPQSRAPV